MSGSSDKPDTEQQTGGRTPSREPAETDDTRRPTPRPPAPEPDWKNRIRTR